MTQREKEIEIDWNGLKEKVVIKRLTNGERNEIMRRSTELKIIPNSEPIVRVDPYNLKEVSMFKCIVKAPFPITEQVIKDLDFELADKIYSEIEAINSISEKKS